MIIKAKPLPRSVFRFLGFFLLPMLRRRFNKEFINHIELKPSNAYSYLLMCNHFGFWDGLFAQYLFHYVLSKQQPLRAMYVMSVKKQMEKKWWLRYTGSFSVDPGKRSVKESLEYAAELLNTPGNVLLYYPQGNLESAYVRQIVFQEGVYEIVTGIKGDCQLLWCTILTEYFESLRPSVYFNFLDCGTNREFNFEALKKQVNGFHNQSIKANFRFTEEP
ncbi:MAG: 1-acyl-sn-glycerol-3-phosphate acyltransferase [Bacteroidetes bacterium]|nr:1-acyl-sn-glycerol-3-phosphate acyltransferase [Bacteroidota bacterium]